MRMLIFLVIIWLLLTALLPARSCGVVVPARGGGSVSIRNVDVAIGWAKGQECLIAQGRFKVDAPGFVWLIPTPSKPEDFPLYIEQHEDLIGIDIYYLTAPRRAYWFNSKAQVHYMWSSGNAVYFVEPVKPFNPSYSVDNLIEPKSAAILPMRSEQDLKKWLFMHNYSAPPKALHVLRSCLKRGWFLTAVPVSKDALRRAINTRHEVVISRVYLKFNSAHPVYPPVSERGIKASICVLTGYRMDFSRLHTDCVMNRSIRGFLGRSESLAQFLFFGLRYDDRSDCTLSKFSGELPQGDMLLRSADSNDIIAPPSVPAPLLENTGSLIMLGIYYLTFPIVSCIFLPIAGSILLRRMGHPVSFLRVIAIIVSCSISQAFILGATFAHDGGLIGIAFIVAIVVAVTSVSGIGRAWQIIWGIISVLGIFGFIIPELLKELMEEATGYWPLGTAAIIVLLYFLLRVMKICRRAYTISSLHE